MRKRRTVIHENVLITSRQSSPALRARQMAAAAAACRCFQEEGGAAPLTRPCQARSHWPGSVVSQTRNGGSVTVTVLHCYSVEALYFCIVCALSPGSCRGQS
jgi:hypothetical protein